MVVVDVELTMV